MLHDGRVVAGEVEADTEDGVFVRVAAEADLTDVLAAIDGVLGVAPAAGAGAWWLRTDREVRPAVGEACVPYGLLELRRHGGLEARFLRATGAR